MLLPPWSADPGLQSWRAPPTPWDKSQDKWRRPAAFAQIISSKTIWEVALTAKKSDGLGKHLGPLTSRVPAARDSCLGIGTTGVSVYWDEGPSIPQFV